MDNKTVVLALSGGMDSATLLGYYLSNNYNVLPISFYYGSKHNKYESICVEQLLKYYNINTSFKINLDFMSNIFKSNLLQSGGDIPEGHYEDKNMKLTVVPGRNLIFASILAGIAESYNAGIIALGVHSGDHEIYPDCRKEFINSLNKTIQLSSDGKVRVEAPFIDYYKKDILKIGYKLDKPFKVPYEYTRTCFIAGTKVHTEKGLIPIQLIQKNDKVYTHTGNLQEVEQLHSKIYSGKLICIEVYGGGKTYCTPDHEIFTNTNFIKAENLSIKNNNCLIPYIKLNYPQKNFCGEFNMTKEFALFLGIFAAEGSYLINRNKNYGPTGIDISINTNEFNHNIIQTVYNYLNNNSKNGTYKRNNVIHDNGFNFGIHDAEFARKLAAISGNGINYKRTFEYVLGWDKEYQYEFLKGYLFGDGFYNIQQNRLQACDTNHNLINVIFNILVLFNKQPRYQHKTPKNCNGILDQSMIFLPDYLYPELILDSFDVQSRILKKLTNPFVKPNGRKIKSLSYLDFEGTVYDISVKNDHSYIVNTIPVHNCYKDQVLSCGCCGSCSERLEAFEQINKVDPIEYHQDYY